MEMKKEQKVNNDYGILINVTNESDLSSEKI
jgi:hypothetical protein